MPTQPPTFRPRGYVERTTPWQPAQGSKVKRQRGRAGQRARAQVMAEEPLCRTCLKNNRTTPSAEVDHIVPLAEGGSDTRSNKQGLCKPCHEAKSAAERAEAAARRRLR